MTTEHKPQKRPRFDLDGSKLERIFVLEITPEDHATRIFAVVADYGWAETILASDCYHHTANDLAWAVGTALDIPFEEASE